MGEDRDLAIYWGRSRRKSPKIRFTKNVPPPAPQPVKRAAEKARRFIDDAGINAQLVLQIMDQQLLC